MSVVSALERIERWAQQNDPEFVALLQPGLTRQEIEDAISGLPFALAEEVYELYRWRNGQGWGEFRFGFLRSRMYPFMSLSKGIYEYTEFQAEDYQQGVEEGDGKFNGSGGWLPVFGMERYYKAMLGAKMGSQTSTILGLTRDGSPYVACSSLTALLEFHADVYEADALRLDEEMGDFFDYTITSAITRRHFPDKVVQAEDEYFKKSNLDRNQVMGTPDRPTKSEFEQFDLVRKLAHTGSLQAIPAVEAYLGWLHDDAEQAKQITQDLVRSPHKVTREGPHKRSLLVQNLSYSFNL